MYFENMSEGGIAKHGSQRPTPMLCKGRQTQDSKLLLANVCGELRSNDAVKEEDGIDRRARREECGVPQAFFPATHTALCALSPTSVKWDNTQLVCEMDNTYLLGLF